MAKRRWIAAVILLLASTGCWALDVESIQLNVAKFLEDGVVDVDPYYLEVSVTGTGISSATVTTPNGETIGLTGVGLDSWTIEADGYDSILGIRTDPDVGFGVFSLVIFGTGGENDSVDLTFDPGNVDPFTGFGAALSPQAAQVTTGLDPTYSWFCSGGSCGASAWDLQVARVDTGDWIHNGWIDPGLTTWSPGGLEPGTEYYFWNQSALLIGGSILPATTTLGDDFEYYPTFEVLNEIQFSTPERVTLTVAKSGPLTVVQWDVISTSQAYDAVMGDLGALRGGDGNYLTAVENCLVDDQITPQLAVDSAITAPGDGEWYLVRGSGGTWDSLVTTQIESRDAELAAAVGSCP